MERVLVRRSAPSRVMPESAYPSQTIRARPEHRGRRLGLATSVGRRRSRPSARSAGDLAVVAVGGEDDDDPVTLGGGARHRARGLRRLVVGMGVTEDDRGHRGPVRRARRRGSADPAGRAGRRCRRRRTGRSGARAPGCARRPVVRRTRSTRRVKASSTSPAEQVEVGHQASGRRRRRGRPRRPRARPRGRRPAVRWSTLAIARPAAASVSAGLASTSRWYSATAPSMSSSCSACWAAA